MSHAPSLLSGAETWIMMSRGPCHQHTFPATPSRRHTFAGAARAFMQFALWRWLQHMHCTRRCSVRMNQQMGCRNWSSCGRISRGHRWVQPLPSCSKPFCSCRSNRSGAIPSDREFAALNASLSTVLSKFQHETQPKQDLCLLLVLLVLQDLVLCPSLDKVAWAAGALEEMVLDDDGHPRNDVDGRQGHLCSVLLQASLLFWPHASKKVLRQGLVDTVRTRSC
eukprot:2665280-Amphidinium_carterae.1